ncbi:hypothetical protein ABPG73_021951 [Tetrahymena malaccensis]
MTEEKQKTIATILSQKSEVQGNVKFGKGKTFIYVISQKSSHYDLKGCIIHPNCTILAEGGDIIFGDYNIIEERVSIVNKKSKDPAKNKNMFIGSYNLFEVGSKVDTSDIGNMNHFEPRSSVEQDCQIKDKCTIGACVKLPQGTIIEDKKIYYPDKVVKELNFDESRFQKHIVSMYQALSILIPQNNPVKQI